jgi:hypothetical protein
MKPTVLRILVAGAALAFLAGCIVLSVYPFYTPKDLIFDPGLAGRWVKVGHTNEFWEFAASGEKCYLLTTTDDQNTNGMDAHLFQLKQHQFLDLLVTNRDPFELLPMHLISQVSRQDTNLSLHFLDYGWLVAMLETNHPGALRHIIVPDRTDTNSSMLYLTADTKDLQRFLLKHVNDTNAFSAQSSVLLQRVSP